MEDQLEEINQLVSSSDTHSENLLSPKKAAKVLGVSESSMKRWCDAGQLQSMRTSGGHRRISISNLLDFAKGRGYELVEPDLVNLPPLTKLDGGPDLRTSVERLVDLLSQGDEKAVRSLVFSTWMTGKSLAAMFDSLIAPAFSGLGHQWESGELQVFEERRACLIMERAFADLRRLIGGVKSTAPLAAGCTLEGDPYSLSTSMCELTLRELGWQAENLGSWEPVDTIVAAIGKLKPRLFWVSVNADFEKSFLVEACSKLFEATTLNDGSLVLGGRALTKPQTREMLDFSVYCESMWEFTKLAKKLHPLTNSEAG
tara:strand:- start:549 stop:1490 length:942 start_codon:yes stop_codon:yes gene_type:complete